MFNVTDVLALVRESFTYSVGDTQPPLPGLFMSGPVQVSAGSSTRTGYNVAPETGFHESVAWVPSVLQEAVRPLGSDGTPVLDVTSNETVFDVAPLLLCTVTEYVPGGVAAEASA